MEAKRTRSEIKREAILNAAKQAFLEHGVQGTSMDMLANLAEVSKRTIYNHFESKEALFMELITELWTNAKQTTGLVYDPDSPLLPQLVQLIDAEIETISSDEYLELNRVAFGHFFFHPEELKKEVEKLATFESSIMLWIKDALADGRLKELEPEVATEQIHSLIKGKCFWCQLLQIDPVLNADERHELATQTAEMFLSRYQS